MSKDKKIDHSRVIHELERQKKLLNDHKKILDSEKKNLACFINLVNHDVGHAKDNELDVNQHRRELQQARDKMSKLNVQIANHDKKITEVKQIIGEYQKLHEQVQHGKPSHHAERLMTQVMRAANRSAVSLGVFIQQQQKWHVVFAKWAGKLGIGSSSGFARALFPLKVRILMDIHAAQKVLMKMSRPNLNPGLDGDCHFPDEGHLYPHVIPTEQDLSRAVFDMSKQLKNTIGSAGDRWLVSKKEIRKDVIQGSQMYDQFRKITSTGGEADQPLALAGEGNECDIGYQPAYFVDQIDQVEGAGEEEALRLVNNAVEVPEVIAAVNEIHEEVQQIVADNPSPTAQNATSV